MSNKSTTHNWKMIYKSPTIDVKVFTSDNTSDLYRVSYYQFRPRYFSGETALADTRRFVADLGDYGALLMSVPSDTMLS